LDFSGYLVKEEVRDKGKAQKQIRGFQYLRKVLILSLSMSKIFLNYQKRILEINLYKLTYLYRVKTFEEGTDHTIRLPLLDLIDQIVLVQLQFPCINFFQLNQFFLVNFLTV